MTSYYQLWHRLQRGRWNALTTIIVALVVAQLIGGCTAGNAGDVLVIYMTGSSDTAIFLSQTPAAPRIDIHSESGIGEAILGIAGEAPPSEMTVRLYLRGLEQLVFSCGAFSIHASVSSDGRQSIDQTMSVADGAETQILPDSEYWIEITPEIAVDGQPAYFDVKLPPAYYKELGLFRLTWIDFYR